MQSKLYNEELFILRCLDDNIAIVSHGKQKIKSSRGVIGKR